MNFSHVEITQMNQLFPLIEEKLIDGHSVHFSPGGISMLPTLRQGKDTVVLSPLPNRLKKYDMVLYRRDNDQYVLHRIIKIGDTYTCIGDNQFSPERGLRQEQMIAIVTSFYRAGRYIKVNNPIYQLYCRIWHYSRLPRRIVRGGINRLRRHFS